MPDLHEIIDEWTLSLPCRDHAPFPEPEVSAPNREYGELLLNAYANGTASELTAVTQYIHHHLTIEERDVANLELCISLVEMQHLSVLGELIRGLGVDPRFWRTNHGYWQGSEVDYGRTTAQKLRVDIFSEEAAIAGYQALIDQICDPKVQAILARIIQDERVHLQLFRRALDRLDE